MELRKQNETKQQKVASRKSKRFPTHIPSNSTYRSLLKASNPGSSMTGFLVIFWSYSKSPPAWRKNSMCVLSKAAAWATGESWLYWNIASENKNWVLNFIQLKWPPVANAHLCVKISTVAQEGKDSSAKWAPPPRTDLSSSPWIYFICTARDRVCLSISNIAFYQIKCFQILHIMFDIRKAACSALLCSNYLLWSPHWPLSRSDLQADPVHLLDRDQLGRHGQHFGS